MCNPRRNPRLPLDSPPHATTSAQEEDEEEDDDNDKEEDSPHMLPPPYTFVLFLCIPQILLYWVLRFCKTNCLKTCSVKNLISRLNLGLTSRRIMESGSCSNGFCCNSLIVQFHNESANFSYFPLSITTINFLRVPPFSILIFFLRWLL